MHSGSTSVYFAVTTMCAFYSLEIESKLAEQREEEEEGKHDICLSTVRDEGTMMTAIP